MLNKTDYKVEGYLIRARQVFIDYIKTVRGSEVDQSSIKTKTIIDIAQMIQREGNPAIYVIGNQMIEPKLKTYLYVIDDDGDQQAEVTAPDFETALVLMQQKVLDQYKVAVNEQLLRIGMTRLE